MSHLSRRAVLAGSVGLAGAALLSACSPDSGGGGGGTDDPANLGLELPTRQTFDGAIPDIPGEENVLDAFFQYPSPPSKFRTDPMPELGTISYLTQGSPPEVPFAENSRYQALAEAIGSDLEIAYGGYGDSYISTFQVRIAADDLPDFVLLQKVARLPDLLQSRFTDLTEHLSGDAVLNYPGLATKPTEAWTTPAINGRIWGVPMPRTAAGPALMGRADVLAERGITDVSISSGQDLVDMFTEVSDSSNNQFAVGSDHAQWLLRIVAAMTGSPNVWRKNDDGTFTHRNTTEEYAAALEEVSKLWAAGVLHPNSFSQASGASEWFSGGVTAFVIAAPTAWSQHDRSYGDILMVEPTTWDGQGEYQAHFQRPAYPEFAAISKQDDPERLEGLLQVLDWFASPFGTQEYLLNNYGVEGDHYTLDGDGNPIANKDNKETVPGVQYLGVPTGVIYNPGNPDLSQQQAETMARMQRNGIQDDSVGLYSESDTTAGAAANATLLDAQREIIQGRRTMSTWQDAVDKWNEDAGKAAAEEYAEAAAIAAGS